MHKNFGEWYRQVSIPCTDESLKRRWAGVESWVAMILGGIALSETAMLLETVRIFRGLPEKTSRERFLEAFRKQDATFAQRDNSHEQQVLAGAALVHCVDTRESDQGKNLQTAVLAATALESSNLHDSDVNRTLEEQVRESRAGLHTLAQEQRRRRSFDTIFLSTKEEETLKKIVSTEVGDHNQLRANFEKALLLMLKAVNRSENALEAAAHGLRCADEETDILWWLAGASSKDLDKPWSELKDATPLIAAWELADLTNVALGPQNAAALLDRTLSEATGDKGKKQALQVYVNAVPDEWAKKRVMMLDAQALDLAPVSFALSKRVESNATTWPSFFEAVSGGLKAGTELAPEHVARQVYTEAMLFRALKDLES